MMIDTKPVSYKGLPFVLKPTDKIPFNNSYYVNKLGLRNPEIENPKPENVYRIVILGDSQAYGAGLEYNETLSFVLQKILNERVLLDKRGKYIEVINAGIPSYNIKNIYYLYLNIIKPIKPDMVIYLFFVNDLMPQEYTPVEGGSKFLFFSYNNDFAVQSDCLKIFPDRVTDFLNSNSYFFRYICYVLDGIEYKIKNRVFNIADIPFSSKRLLIYLTKMQELSDEIGSLFFTFVLYRPDSMSRCVIPEDEQVMISALFDYAAKWKIKIVDLMGCMCGIPIQTLDIGDGVHYKAIGHKIIAEEIYKKISEYILF